MKLLGLARYFRDGLKAKGFAVRGASQIIPVIIGDNFRTQELARRLQEKGYWVAAVRPPTVPKNEARLRFSLTSHHSEEILQRLINDIAEVRV